MNEYAEAIERAYEALSDLIDMALENEHRHLMVAADRARDHINALYATAEVQQ